MIKTDSECKINAVALESISLEDGKLSAVFALLHKPEKGPTVHCGRIGLTGWPMEVIEALGNFQEIMEEHVCNLVFKIDEHKVETASQNKLPRGIGWFEDSTEKDG